MGAAVWQVMGHGDGRSQYTKLETYVRQHMRTLAVKHTFRRVAACLVQPASRQSASCHFLASLGNRMMFCGRADSLRHQGLPLNMETRSEPGLCTAIKLVFSSQFFDRRTGQLHGGAAAAAEQFHGVIEIQLQGALVVVDAHSSELKTCRDASSCGGHRAQA